MKYIQRLRFYHNRATCYLAGGDLQKGGTDLDRLIALSRRASHRQGELWLQTDTFIWRSGVRIAAGNLQGAEADLQEYLRRHPAKVTPYEGFFEMLCYLDIDQQDQRACRACRKFMRCNAVLLQKLQKYRGAPRSGGGSSRSGVSGDSGSVLCAPAHQKERFENQPGCGHVSARHAPHVERSAGESLQ